VRSAATPDSVNRIVLVGDGVPNDAPPVLALADPAKGEHTPVTALGPGNDFDETLMTALAQRSAGTFQFVDDASRVAAVFEDQISRLDRVVARSTPPRGGALEQRRARADEGDEACRRRLSRGGDGAPRGARRGDEGDAGKLSAQVSYESFGYPSFPRPAVVARERELALDR